MSHRIRTDEGESDIYSLAIKAVNQGGLYTGIFREEPALSFLQLMETAGFTILSGFYNYLVTSRYSQSEIEKYLIMALDLVQNWGSTEGDAEAKDVMKEYPNINSLYKSTSCVYAREIYKHMKPGDKIMLKIPRFKEFYLCFLKRLARDPFVRTPTYFRGSKILERKLVHMDALRYALENCVRKGIEVNGTDDGASVASSPTAYSPSPAPYARPVGVGRIGKISDYEEDDIRPEDSVSNAPTPSVRRSSEKPYTSPFAKPLKTGSRNDSNRGTETPTLRMLPIQLGSQPSRPSEDGAVAQKPAAPAEPDPPVPSAPSSPKKAASPSASPKTLDHVPSPKTFDHVPSPAPSSSLSSSPAAFDALPSPALSASGQTPPPDLESLLQPPPASSRSHQGISVRTPSRSPMRIAEYATNRFLPTPSFSGSPQRDDKIKTITVRQQMVDFPAKKSRGRDPDQAPFRSRNDMIDSDDYSSPSQYESMEDPWGGEDAGPLPPTSFHAPDL